MPTRYAPFDWYETPVYYDIVFDSDTAHDVVFLRRLMGLHVRTTRSNKPTAKPMRLLEPACGSGRLLAPLAKLGHEAVGVDLSEPMLDFARQRLSKAKVADRVTLIQAPMEAFKIPGGAGNKADFAFNLVSSFKYLSTEKAAAAHLSCVADALKPGGVYALGLHLTDYDLTSRQRERWVAKRGGTHVVCNIQSWPPDRKARTERVRSRLIVTHPNNASKPEKRYETHWDFRTYDLPQLHKLLAKEPRLEHVATYGFDHDADRPQYLDGAREDNVLILRKR